MHQKHDSFRTLKYIGYCLSQLPPDPKTRSYEDYVNHAKYRLSVERGLLLKDPIWEKYTDEEVLIEHFALIFDKDKETVVEEPKVEESKKIPLELVGA